jgi:hypothetical protein
MNDPIDFLPPVASSKKAPQLNNEVRELTMEEIQTLAPIFATAGCGLPDPKVSTFVGAVKDGQVVGFIVLQVKLHAEPMWIRKGESECFKALVRKAEEVVLAKSGPQWVYLFAPAGRVSQLASSMGMQLEPWNVLSKLVAPEPPPRVPVDLSDVEVDDELRHQ